MGEDDLTASLAHAVLCCVGGNGIGRMSGRSFIHPGMHANFFIHGILGFFHYSSNILKNDFKPAYTISLKATRYLALPCLMADLYRGNNTLSTIHLLSGVVPFALSLAGEDNVPLGNLAIACNIISLCHYTINRVGNKEWGWYTAAAATVAYFATMQAEQRKVLYPLTLALMEYCAYRIFHVHYSP